MTRSSSAVPELSQTVGEGVFVVFSGRALGYLVMQHKITDIEGVSRAVGMQSGEGAPLAKEFGEGFEKNVVFE